MSFPLLHHHQRTERSPHHRCCFPLPRIHFDFLVPALAQSDAQVDIRPHDIFLLVLCVLFDLDPFLNQKATCMREKVLQQHPGVINIRC